jgi:hypothetical protein
MSGRLERAILSIIGKEAKDRMFWISGIHG